MEKIQKQDRNELNFYQLLISLQNRIIKVIKNDNTELLSDLIKEREAILIEITRSKRIPSNLEKTQILSSYQLLLDELTKKLTETKIDLKTTKRSRDIINKYKISEKQYGNPTNI